MAVTPVGNMDTCKNTVMFWKARLSQGRLGNIVSTMDVILVGDMDILIDFVMNESTISRRLGVKTNVMLSQKAIVRFQSLHESLNQKLDECVELLTQNFKEALKQFEKEHNETVGVERPYHQKRSDEKLNLLALVGKESDE
ncbi:hypothetical protein F2Q68_00013967 [Brassica cretica]|uniref:Uncharacterized protein n=1 Tax=Brassica cretica TaxID=69181 RepID=A0A8S9H7Z5_BRACR|nr:hypothetical protein F2Q68_00013967 [Brassica cretica]